MKAELWLESSMKQLKLPCFAQSYQTLAQEAARTNLSYERYLLAVAQEEMASRDAHRIERAISQARFPTLKELADFEWSSVPSVPKARILKLAHGAYIAKAEPVLFPSIPALGKSHLPTAPAFAPYRPARPLRFYTP